MPIQKNEKLQFSDAIEIKDKVSEEKDVDLFAGLERKPIRKVPSEMSAGKSVNFNTSPGPVQPSRLNLEKRSSIKLGQAQMNNLNSPLARFSRAMTRKGE